MRRSLFAALALGATCLGSSAWAALGGGGAPLADPSAATAPAGKYHAIDSAVLLPNADPDALPSIEDLGPEVLGSLGFDKMIRGLDYVDAPAVEKAIGPVEASTARCFASAKNWKAVAVRLDPFWEPSLGAPRRDAATVPMIRMTFQPFCFTDRAGAARSVTSDAAIRFAFVVGDRRDVAPLLTAWDGLNDAAARAEDVTAKQDRVTRLAGALEPATRSLVAAITFLRDRRELTGTSTAAFDRQAGSFVSSIGLPSTDPTDPADPTGAPRASLVHPLFDAPKDNITWKALFSSLRPSLDIDHLESVGMMSSAMGGLGWVFSRYNPRKHTLSPLLVTRENERGKVEVVSNLGTHDFKEIGDRLRDLTGAERKFYAKDSVLGRMDEDPIQAKAALAIYERQNDPARTSHAGQSCMECHASQERVTAAMKAEAGMAPREFGYFFRAFGYMNGEPFASRRLFREVDAVTERLNTPARLASMEKGS